MSIRIAFNEAKIAIFKLTFNVDWISIICIATGQQKEGAKKYVGSKYTALDLLIQTKLEIQNGARYILYLDGTVNLMSTSNPKIQKPR